MLIPLFISLAIGYCVNALILRKSSKIHPGLSFFLSMGLGLSISALITFYSFLVFNQYNRHAILGTNVILLASLIFLNYRTNRQIFSLSNKSKIERLSFKSIFLWSAVLGVILLLFYVAYTLALRYPYGHWDGWALWNMKAKFLFLSETSWKNIFSEMHGFTQPDYPLLLPFIHVWCWTWSGHLLPHEPLLIGILFTLGCGGLLFFGLFRYIKLYWAMMATGLLLSLPCYLSMGTWQYADVILAYFLLASFVSLTMAIREQEKEFMFLAGIFLGLMAFTKNEGILIAFLITFITVLNIFLESKRDYKVSVRQLLFGLALTLPAAMIFKLFLAPPNKDILLQNLTPASQFFNLEGCYMIISSFLRQITKSYWQYTWLLLGFAAATHYRRYWQRETKIMTLFIISFILVLLLIYLGTAHFSLMWRLARTLPRILFYLYPSALFLTFYAYEYKK